MIRLLPEQSLLIGSTTERPALREEIDRAYEEFAKIDQIKDASKQQEEIAHIDIVNRRKKLREERAARVLPVTLFGTQQLLYRFVIFHWVSSIVFSSMIQ